VFSYGDKVNHEHFPFVALDDIIKVPSIMGAYTNKHLEESTKLKKDLSVLQ
jgi:hypothetical protein